VLTFFAIDVIKKVYAVFHDAVADIAEITIHTYSHISINAVFTSVFRTMSTTTDQSFNYQKHGKTTATNKKFSVGQLEKKLKRYCTYAREN